MQMLREHAHPAAEAARRQTFSYCAWNATAANQTAATARSTTAKSEPIAAPPQAPRQKQALPSNAQESRKRDFDAATAPPAPTGAAICTNCSLDP